MRNYFCDICGAAIPPKQAAAICSPEFAALTACRPQVEDLCKSCAEIGRKIDVRAIIFQHWKQTVGAGPPALAEDSPLPGRRTGSRRKKPERVISADQSCKSGPGNHWRKKKIIYKQLTKYRKEGGLGCLQPLAEKSGVPLDVIRQLLEAQQVEIETWRKVGAALDDLGVVLTDEELSGC